MQKAMSQIVESCSNLGLTSPVYGLQKQDFSLYSMLTISARCCIVSTYGRGNNLWDDYGVGMITEHLDSDS